MSGPGQRRGFEVAYDSARNRLVMFGGRLGTTFLPETWEWDGNDWSLRATGGPPGRRSHAMAFDSGRGETVLFGGWDDTSNVVYADTWVWDGTNWLLRTPATSPAERTQHAMVYDSTRARVVMAGGRRNLGTFVEYQETWEWDGSQ